MKSPDAKSVRFTAAVSLASAIACLAQTSGQKMPDNGAAKLVGTWRGASTCMVKDSPCRDEINVYHISAVAGKPDTFSVVGTKIVEGREVVMGTTEGNQDARCCHKNYFHRFLSRL
ncbi:MAG TPA: hypothetical protein VJN21_11895 [Candidatus Acidoferrales bacterium]|nr:hypothetical protein [Candidatus Acidoferrales bacterium]